MAEEKKPFVNILRAIERNALEMYVECLRSWNSDSDRAIAEWWNSSFGVPLEAGILLTEGMLRRIDDGPPAGPTMIDRLVEQITERTVERVSERVAVRFISMVIEKIAKPEPEAVEEAVVTQLNAPPVPVSELPPPPAVIDEPEPEPEPEKEPSAPSLPVVNQRLRREGATRPFADIVYEILRDTGKPMKAPAVEAICRDKYARRPSAGTIQTTLGYLARKYHPVVRRVDEGTYQYFVPQAKPKSDPPPPLRAKTASAPPANRNPIVMTKCNQCPAEIPNGKMAEHKRSAHPVTDNPNGRDEPGSGGLGSTLSSINF